MKKLILLLIINLWHVFVGCAIAYFLWHIYSGEVINELRFLLPAAIVMWIIISGYGIYKNRYH